MEHKGENNTNHSWSTTKGLFEETYCGKIVKSKINKKIDQYLDLVKEVKNCGR